MPENKCQINDQYLPITFTITPNPMLEDQRLSCFDVMTFMALKYFAGAVKNNCWPSVKKLAILARCSERTVYKSLQHLEELKYISRQQRFNGKEQLTTIYVILPYSAVNKTSITDSGAAPLHTVQDATACGAGGPLHTVQGTTAYGADRTRFNELDSKNIIPPYIPLKGENENGTEKNADEEQIPETTLTKDPFRASCQYIMHDYPEMQAKKIMNAVQRWSDLYGADFVLQQIKHALSWQADNPKRRKKDAVRFIGNWLRASEKRKNNRPAADPKVDAWFDEFWRAWPGLPDGKDGAREEWRRRFASLDTSEEQNHALDAMERQLNDLIERGTAPQFIPRAKNFIRDASLEG